MIPQVSGRGGPTCIARDSCQDVRKHPGGTDYVDTLVVPNKPTQNCPVLTLEIAQLIPDTLYRIFFMILPLAIVNIILRPVIINIKT